MLLVGHYIWDGRRSELSTGFSKMQMCCLLSHFSCVWLFETLWTLAHQAPLAMGFSRQEYHSGLPCPPPGDLPDTGIEPATLTSPALAGEFFVTGSCWEALKCNYVFFMTSSPLLIPLVHRTPCRSSMIPKPCAVTSHSAGTPGSTRRKRQAMSVQGETFWVRILKYKNLCPLREWIMMFRKKWQDDVDVELLKNQQ